MSLEQLESSILALTPKERKRFAQWFETERAATQRSLPRPPGLVGDMADGLVLWLGFQL